MIYVIVAAIFATILFILLPYPIYAISLQNETGQIDIKVGDSPTSIDFNPNSNLIYVANRDSDTVSVIDGKTNRILTNISVGNNPQDLAVDQKSNRIYVANRDSDTVSVIDGKTNRILTNISVGNLPVHIAINSVTNKIYVAYRDDNLVSIISGNTTKVLKNISMAARNIAVDQNRNIVYFSGSPSAISIMDGNTFNVTDSISVASYPSDIAIDTATNKVYTVNNDANRISIIDIITKNVETIVINDLLSPSFSPSAPAIDLDLSKDIIYISNPAYNMVSLINSSSRKVLSVIDINNPSDIFFNSNTNLLYALNDNSNIISVIDTMNNNISKKLHKDQLKDLSVLTYATGFKVNPRPISIAVNQATNKIYVAYGANNKVSVYNADTDALIKNVLVGNGMKEIAVDQETNKIYVASQIPGNISVIDGDDDTVQANINLDNSVPFDLAVIPSGNVYISAQDSGKIFQIDGLTNQMKNFVIALNNTHVADQDSILIGNTSNYIALNPVKEKLYVIQADSRNWSLPASQLHNNTLYELTGFEVLDPKEETTLVKNNLWVKDLAVNPNTDLIYVSGQSLSVIDGYTNNQVIVIPGLYDSSSIGINPDNNMIYVSNDKNNTIFVVNGSSNQVQQTIHLSMIPYEEYQHHDVAVNRETNMVYVTNEKDNTVSIINGSSNKLVVGLRFNIEPQGSGRIICNNKDMPNNQYVRIENGTRCLVEPDKDFIFTSWSGNISANMQDKSSKVAYVYDYGDLTANFREAPTRVSIILPNQFYETLVLGIILPSIAGWFVPFIVDQYSNKKHRKIFKQNLEEIDSIYNDNSKYNQEEYIKLLYEKKTQITRLLKEGAIDDSFYSILIDRISGYIDEINSHKS